MTNAIARAPLKLKGKFVLVGALVTLGLTLGAGWLAAAFGSPNAAVLLGILAFLAAGAVTRMLSETVQPREPALGAAIAIGVLSGLQWMMLRRKNGDLPTLPMLVSLLFAIVFAYALTWLGARLVTYARTRSNRTARPA